MVVYCSQTLLPGCDSFTMEKAITSDYESAKKNYLASRPPVAGI